MTSERISELRALCAEYEQKKAACEAAGLKVKAADIAADGVGRRALETMPELLDELESLDLQVNTLCNWISDAMKSPETLVLYKHAVGNFPSPESLKKMTKDRIYECQS